MPDDPNDDEVEFVINAEDLEEVSLQSQNMADFFSDPQPRPLRSTALVETKCSRTANQYYLVFEKSGDGTTWVVCYSLEGQISVISSDSQAGISVRSKLVGGKIDWKALSSEGKCPYCALTSVVKCGRCKRLSCQPGGEQGRPFHCPWCGTQGKVTGTIKSLDATEGKGKKNK